jgi:hypothetical protein
MSTPVALYYRLRFSAAQLTALKTLAHSGLALTGTITYQYAAPQGTGESATPLTVQLAAADLELSTDPAPSPTAWLADLLATTHLNAAGVFDGPYSLGGGWNVTLKNTRTEGWLLGGTWSLSSGEDGVIRLNALRTPDMTGRITFDVPNLALHVKVDYQAKMLASLDLQQMRVDISELSITTATISGTTNPFYTSLLRQLLADPAVLARVSQSLTDELQRRILSHTLIGLEEVLP